MNIEGDCTPAAMSVTFTRHAESLANTGQFYIDSPLSPLGRQQAAQLVGHFTQVWMSPLRRTHETLYFSQITYDALEILPELHECRNGPCDYKFWELCGTAAQCPVHAKPVALSHVADATIAAFNARRRLRQRRA